VVRASESSVLRRRLGSVSLISQIECRNVRAVSVIAIFSLYPNTFQILQLLIVLEDNFVSVDHFLQLLDLKLLVFFLLF